jgi:hypothetical protein
MIDSVERFNTQIQAWSPAQARAAVTPTRPLSIQAKGRAPGTSLLALPSNNTWDALNNLVADFGTDADGVVVRNGTGTLTLKGSTRLTVKQLAVRADRLKFVKHEITVKQSLLWRLQGQIEFRSARRDTMSFQLDSMRRSLTQAMRDGADPVKLTRISNNITQLEGRLGALDAELSADQYQEVALAKDLDSLIAEAQLLNA